MLRKKRRSQLRHAELLARLFTTFQIIGGIIVVGKDLFSMRLQNISQYVGIIIFIPSFLLWLIARIQLGKCCTLLPVAKQLVTHGIYSKFRNPIYLFGTTTLIGFFLLHELPEGLFTLFLVIPIQFVRGYKESVALEDHFGQFYHDYVQQTWI